MHVYYTVFYLLYIRNLLVDVLFLGVDLGVTRLPVTPPSWSRLKYFKIDSMDYNEP